MKNKIYFFALIFILLLVSISNYKVFDSNIEQYKLTQYLSGGTIGQIDKDYLDRISTKYPTLSSTVIPFKSITGTYWLENDSILKGLDLLRQSNKENPYLGFPDAMLAGFNDYLGMKDSFNFYARSAYNKLPNAPQHYVLLAKTLLNENNLDSLDIFFNNIKSNVIDKQIFKIYFAAALNNKDKFDSISLYENINLAKSYFDRDGDIDLLTDYIIYGEENVKEIIKLRQKAVDSFENNPKYSIKIMEDIVGKIYDNIDFYEVLIEMYFKNGNYTDVVNLHNYLNDNNATRYKAFIVELVSISYVNLGDLQNGCNLAMTLFNYNYKLSQGLAKVCNIS
tara:strand:- start:398 stop:1408 length:1011 start_codon:yes stop_codon:yes gene_type:complete